MTTTTTTRSQAPVRTMDPTIVRTHVDSSNVEAVGYNPSTQVFQVEFKNGKIYEYDGVTPELAALFWAGQREDEQFSAGKWVNRNLVKADFACFLVVDPSAPNE